jgi:opacity protein-like surface antigen
MQLKIRRVFMIRKTLIALSTTALLATTGMAFAAGNAPSGTIVQGDIGFTDLGTPSATMSATGTKHVGHSSWGLGFGYDWAVQPNWAVGIETGYRDLGNSEYTQNTGNSLKTSQTAFDLLLTTGYYFDSGFDVFAKAGMARVKQKITVNGTVHVGSDGTLTASDSQSKTSVRPMGQIGFGYNWNFGPSQGDFGLQVAYSEIFGKSYGNWTNLYNDMKASKDAKVADSGTTSINLVWYFPM